jgi:hypothetical protein
MNVAIATTQMMDTQRLDVASLVYELINGEPGTYYDSYSIAFMSKTGAFEAGLVFTNYVPEWSRVEVNIAAVKKNWLTLNRLIAIMNVPIKLGVEVVVSKTDPWNKAAIQLMERCGAKTYTIKDGRGFGKDEVYQTMLIEDMKKSKFWRKASGR